MSEDQKTRTLLISFSDPILLLKEKIDNYFKQYGTTVDYSLQFNINDYFYAMFSDIGDDGADYLVPSQQMLAGKISKSLQLLIDLGINQQSATLIELAVFKHVVDAVSQALPRLSFGELTNYSFKFINSDLAIDFPRTILPEDF